MHIRAPSSDLRGGQTVGIAVLAAVREAGGRLSHVRERRDVVRRRPRDRACRERECFIDNLLVRIHFIIGDRACEAVTRRARV